MHVPPLLRKIMSFWAKEKASHFTDYRESVEDVTTAHIFPSTLWFMPTHHYANQIWLLSESTGAFLCTTSLVCEQLRPLIIKLEPLLKVTAKTVWQLGQLFNKCVRFIYSDCDFGLYPLSAWPPGGLGLRHGRFRWRGVVWSRWAALLNPAETFVVPRSACCY